MQKSDAECNGSKTFITYENRGSRLEASKGEALVISLPTLYHGEDTLWSRKYEIIPKICSQMERRRAQHFQPANHHARPRADTAESKTTV